MAYEPVTVREAAQIEVLLFVALSFVGALAVIYWGFQTYQFGRIIRDTAPEPVSGVAMGRTELVGTVLPATRVFDQPFTEGKCVYAEFKVREYEEADDDDEDDQWKTVQSETVSAPFYIDDGTGTMLVEPTDETLYELSGDCSTTISVGRRERPPEHVREFLTGGSGRSSISLGNALGGAVDSVTSLFSGADQAASADRTETPNRTETTTPATPSDTQEEALTESQREAFSALGESELRAIRRGERDPPDALADVMAGQVDENTARDDDSDRLEYVTRGQLGSVSGTNQKRRYIQTVLPIDKEAYVFGGATRKDPSEIKAGEESVRLSTDPGTGEFIVSDKDEFELSRRYRLRSTLYIAGGLIAAAMILALLVQILVTGPVFGIDWATP